MLIPLGILASAGGVPPIVSDYELISTTVLGSAQSSVVFDVSAFASTYRHLQIRLVAKQSSTGYGDFRFRFNSDSGSNYSDHVIYGNGSSVTSLAQTSQTSARGGWLVRNSTANIFSAGVVDILDAYSTTKNKTFRSLAGGPDTSARFIYFGSGAYYSTDSLTSVTITPDDANFLTGSRFSIYGVK
jgi:hypothetical protein